MALDSVKNLIFDLGGVLLDLHIHRTHEAFAKIGNVSIEEIRERISQSTFFDAYEKGSLTDQQFRTAIRSFLDPSLTDNSIDLAWNAMLGDLPLERIKLLERLSKQYRLFLLSNTNNIHLQSFSETVKRVSGQPSLSAFFEMAYYSHLMKMRKPDSEIFEFVLNQHKLEANQTLFLDDNENNLKGAAALGIQTFHVHNPQAVLSLFS